MAKSKSQERREAVQKAAAEMPPKIVKVKEDLSCELTDVEWQNRARELAEANQEVVTQEQRKKDINKELTADVATAKSRASKLTTVVSTRREQREVTVQVKYDYELGRVIKTRTDTGEVISDREMTDNERQAELDLYSANELEAGDESEDNEISEEELDS